MGDIWISAQIELLAASEGGKTVPVRAFYRPNHNFGDAENRDFHIGQIEFAAGETLSSGEARELKVRFMETPGLRELAVPGRKWRIQEGNVLVGYGTVLKVLY